MTCDVHCIKLCMNCITWIILVIHALYTSKRLLHTYIIILYHIYQQHNNEFTPKFNPNTRVDFIQA